MMNNLRAYMQRHPLGVGLIGAAIAGGGIALHSDIGSMIAFLGGCFCGSGIALHTRNKIEN
jgi:hypothetical protein